jgi:hypothetical protein
MTKTWPVSGAPFGANPNPTPNSTQDLVLDFLAWLAPGPRPYAEVMDGWRTSCPRLPVWEDAVDGGLVVRRREGAGEAMVSLTAEGREWLVRAGRVAA